MTPKDHAKILGILFLILGIIILAGTFGCVIMFFMLGGFDSLRSENIGLIPIGFIMGISSLVMIILFILFVVPSLVAGLYLVKGNGKGKILTVITSVFYVLQFPIGTALGIYALWFVFGEEGRKYFRN